MLLGLSSGQSTQINRYQLCSSKHGQKTLWETLHRSKAAGMAQQVRNRRDRLSVTRKDRRFKIRYSASISISAFNIPLFSVYNKYDGGYRRASAFQLKQGISIVAIVCALHQSCLRAIQYITSDIPYDLYAAPALTVLSGSSSRSGWGMALP